MDRGIYAASSAGLYHARQVEAISHNLANANTVGFKVERLVNREQEFGDTLAGKLPMPDRASADHEHTPGVVHVFSTTDFSAGPISHTGSSFDVALGEEETFFVLQTPEGERYTRAGNFKRDSATQLVSADGFPVLGQGGPIALGEGQVRISSGGVVTSDGEEVGRIRVVSIDDPKGLRREEGVRFRFEDGGEAQDVEANLVPQAVEMPNVNIVESMVALIQAHKGFEAYSKTVQTIDELNSTGMRAGAGGGAV